MKCPVCRDQMLAAHVLEGELGAEHCLKCGGNWVRGKDYFRWLEGHPQKAEGSGEPEQTVQDSGPAKLCPECGRFLTRHAVGHGIGFHLDRCAGCGGFWLDANEWETLRGKSLENRIHLVFSSAWQADVARQQRMAGRLEILKKIMGEKDLEEIQRIKAWIDAHPRRAELYAFLSEGH